jgi:hypothetical protein
VQESTLARASRHFVRANCGPCIDKVVLRFILMDSVEGILYGYINDMA